MCPDHALLNASDAVVRFGVFEADLRSGELHKNGVKVKIQDLPFLALKLLLSRPGEVIHREEFRHAMWADDVFVDFDGGISSAIKRLRDALGDSADNPIFIETIDRHGYRWIAPVQIPEQVAEADGKTGGQTVIPARSFASVRWKFVFVLPVVALLFAVWIFRPSYRLAKAGSRAQPASSSAAGLRQPAANHEAEDFYLKGRYYWEKRTPESLHQAVDSFTQAVVHDPNYAPAYVGLADCYNLMREYTVMPASEAYPRALAAAKKAVELDEQSSEAHASLAFASYFGMWDAATADREFRRAIELNPSNAQAHHWYATFLASRLRFEESLTEIDRAQTLDPGSKSVLADKGAIFFDSGHLPEAIALLKQMEENEPDFISPHRYLRFIYLQTADYPHYLLEAKREAVLMHDPNSVAAVALTEKGFATGGGRGLLEALLRQQVKTYENGLTSPYYLAVTCSLLGDKREALRYLKIAYDQHEETMTAMAANRAFDRLHDEPEFRELLAEVGLPASR